MSNIGKAEVNTSYTGNDECSDSGRKCELKTEHSSVTVTNNGKQDIFNKARCCGGEYSLNNIMQDVKLSMCDLSEKNPEFLISTIKELQRKIEYTEKMNWLCKWKLFDYNYFELTFTITYIICTIIKS